ncbi:PadR family transcriptional regulator [Acidilobus sp. 7A]|uniref:PadR family transcriptional regulator n=1 Tax=Acidilobus sp. 7A TaxID=1577685 RepID=UPI000E3B763F|nr:PadR family transcriptional regulator [Acidilobus sp. 7A]
MKGGLLKGLATFLILAELADRPKCGYEIGKEISKKVGGKLPPGYVYVMLGTLERKGLVESERSAGRKKEYRLTESGVRFLIEHEEHIKRLIELLSEVQGVVKGLKETELQAEGPATR